MLDYMPRFDFTPDGEAVVLATGGTFHRIQIDSKDDEAIAFTADVEQELGPFVHFDVPLTDDPVQVRNIRYANTSPDGARMVFSALSRIWIQELPDGEPRRLAPDQDFGQFQPVFSPDGRSVVYVSWDDDTFERSSHFIMFEEPGRFLMTLVSVVLPLAERPAASPVG